MAVIAGRNHSDPYYAVTALLAARDLQTQTRRLVAVVIAGLGVLPVGLIGTSAGPRGSLDQVIAVVIAGSALVMAMRWLGDGWPSLLESRVGAAVGAVGIGVACLIETDPLCGVLGAGAFVVLGTYIACAHGRASLAVYWTAVAITIGVLASRIAVHDFALAIFSAILIVLTNLAVVAACRTAVRLAVTDIDPAGIDPATGLLNRDAFYAQTATLLGARSRLEDRFLTVVAVGFDDVSPKPDAAERETIRIQTGAAQVLRETLRSDAVVARFTEREFIIAEVLASDDPTPLVDRIRSAIRTTPLRLTASIGVVSHPLAALSADPPYDVIHTFVALARNAAFDARVEGGDRVHYIDRDTASGAEADPAQRPVETDESVA